MSKIFVLSAFIAALCLGAMAKGQATTTSTTRPAVNVLAFYSTKVEKAHVQFAYDAIDFYGKLSTDKKFTFEMTTDWSRINDEELAKYQVILWLNNQPGDPKQRNAFQRYMERGGGWIGYHVAGYNDRNSHWPWFVDFLGGAVFYTNNWPVMPAKLIVDTNDHPVTAHLPTNYDAPANEFYQWKPSPRLNSNVKVLLTLDPVNYPLGKKDLLVSGDIPVVWTNTKYRMLYINMGHGDKIMTSDIQNQLFKDGLYWVAGISEGK